MIKQMKNAYPVTKLFKIILLAAILAVPFQSCAQKQKSAEKMQQEHFDRQAKQKAESEKAKEKALERHKKIQTKETRKRMKESRKKAKRYKDNRKDPFLKRLFRKKRR